MRKSIVLALIGIMAAGVARSKAAAATGTSWDQNVNFTLTTQSASGKKVVTTKDIIADLSGAVISATTITTTNPTITGVTSTNLPGTNFPACAMHRDDRRRA